MVKCKACKFWDDACASIRGIVAPRSTAAVDEIRRLAREALR